MKQHGRHEHHGSVEIEDRCDDRLACEQADEKRGRTAGSSSENRACGGEDPLSRGCGSDQQEPGGERECGPGLRECR
jgi:hypothetical protein